MELVDFGRRLSRAAVSKFFAARSTAGGVVKAINAKGFAGITIGQVDELTAIAKTFGAKGLAFIKVENGEWKSPIVKFFSDAEKEALRTRLQIEEGDLIFFAAGQMGDRLRSARAVSVAHRRDSKTYGRSPSQTRIFFGSPIFRCCNGARKKINGTRCIIRSRDRKRKTCRCSSEKKFAEIRAEAYDVVLNGVEIGGGSIRIHEPELQEKMFEALGISAEDQQAQFGHLLRAFRLGAPPHGGIALGLDRLVMLICGEESIRDVMAFPKNNRGLDLMSQSPAEVDPKQLRDLGIKLANEKK